MKFIVASRATVLGLLAAVEAVKHGHRHNSRHANSAAETPIDCKFPSDAGLVSVTPTKMNAGWAMSPDQSCKRESYCPYACPPGQVSMQWDPKATSYSYPLSMNGGLYCDKDGKIQKPFPDRPYCQDGTGSVIVRNRCNGGEVSFCQTVLPGNEAMLIPTLVQKIATLAVPDTSYWVNTAAHFYINPPGYGTETACVWGDPSQPIGNWSPYVAGANTDSNGNTFLKIGWNPIYLEPQTPFRNEVPKFGIEIECEGNGCNGLPCAIDPVVNAVNEMSGSREFGAGGAAFCVVTVPKGEKASIVVFDKGGSSGDGSPSTPSTPSTPSAPSSSSSTVSVSTSSTSIGSSSTTSTTTSNSTVISPTTTSTPSTTPTTEASTTSSTLPTSTSTPISASTPVAPTLQPSLSWNANSSMVPSHWPSTPAGYAAQPQVMAGTKVLAYAGSMNEPMATPIIKNGASGQQICNLGLIVAVIAAIW